MQPKDSHTIKLLTSVAGTAAVCFLSSFPSCWEVRLRATAGASGSTYIFDKNRSSGVSVEVAVLGCPS